MAMNMALKFAIVNSRKRQIEIAKRARIHETRLSKIINGYLDANEDEKKALARVLRTSVDELFPVAAAGAQV